MSQAKRTDRFVKILLLAALFAVLLLFMQCGPPRLPATEDRAICAPADFSIRPGDHSLHLQWRDNCPDEILLSGYNVYVTESPIYDKYYDRRLPGKIEPINNTPYPGDTTPEDNLETMTVENLENGIEYFVSVRAVYADRSESYSSAEIPVICRPEGEFELEIRYAGLKDGFSFETGRSTRADADDNDLYFYHADEFDFIASPDRLSGYLRESRFYSLGKTSDIYQYEEIELDIPPVKRMPVRAGESYMVYTADQHYAKIRIERITGAGDDRTLHIKYIYQTIPNLMRF